MYLAAFGSLTLSQQIEKIMASNFAHSFSCMSSMFDIKRMKNVKA
jgi:hypothetical protein